MKNPFRKLLMLQVILVMAVSCKKDSPVSLVEISNVPPGVLCISGGYKIETGTDHNNNTVLDVSEVQDSVYICNEIIRMVNVAIEEAGEQCESGGYKIETGIDINKNGILEMEEIQHSEYICNPYFGITRSDFTSGTVYYAETDGFLSVSYTSSSFFGNINGYIYSDNSEDPKVKIGNVNFVTGFTTVPVKKGNYWKVEDVSGCVEYITWIPIQH